ncbi:uncharacterized protein LOC135586202 isoform X2 [Musa acuminata AAA Group]|uniref:uncharacterized protein LOC135586202 isoform X2 n=1 Tax=Musa acuminata AAA Group TaxID=214697 RepID=UPI0031CFCBBA
MPRRDGRNAQRQQQPGFGQTVAGILLMALLSYFAMKFFGPKRPAEPFQLISNLFHKGDSLLKNDNRVEAKDEGPVDWVSYWKPNITINFVDNFTSGRKKIRHAYSSMPLLLMRKRCTSSVVTEQSALPVNECSYCRCHHCKSNLWWLGATSL